MTPAALRRPMTVYLPWTERSGRLSLFKFAVFLAVLLPGLVVAIRLALGDLGPEPYKEALHQCGLWTVRFLLLSLAVTPARSILRWNKIIGVRRMLGLATLAYALAHLVLYAASLNWDLTKVGSEIVLRFYLTIGAIALVGLIALGVTSTDGAIRRMGRNWRRLHWLVYSIGVLGLWHFFLQTRVDVSEATLMAGLFVLLMLYRVLTKLRWPLSGSLVAVLLLAGAAILAALVTVGIEYLWYDLATGLPASRVVAANLTPFVALRPAWWVGFAGLAIAGVALIVFLRGVFFGGASASGGRRHRC